MSQTCTSSVRARTSTSTSCCSRSSTTATTAWSTRSRSAATVPWPCPRRRASASRSTGSCSKRRAFWSFEAERSVYTVQLIKVGESQVRGPEAFWMARWDEWIPLVFYIVLIRGQGRTVVLNTGPPDDLSDTHRVRQGYLGDPRSSLVHSRHEPIPSALDRPGL